MVKLTVTYTLPPGGDDEEFLRWRTTVHQRENMGIPGVIKSDFYVIKEAWRDPQCPYRYITEAYWAEMAFFEAAFHDPGYQDRQAESLTKIADPLFLISEELLSESNRQPSKSPAGEAAFPDGPGGGPQGEQDPKTLLRAGLDRRYVEQFAGRVRELFRACPPGRENAIAEHACLKYSDRIGRSAQGKSLDEQAVRPGADGAASQ